MAKALDVVPKLALIAALVTACGSSPRAEPAPVSTPVVKPAPSAAAAHDHPGETQLPSACERADQKIATATKLGDEGFVVRATRLLAQASALCPVKQEIARGLVTKYQKSAAAAANGAGSSGDELWAASRQARGAGDLVRMRRLASLAAARYDKQGTRVTAWSSVAGVEPIAFSRDGSALLGRTSERVLVILDPQKLEPRVFLELPDEKNPMFQRYSGDLGAQFSPSGGQIAVLEQSTVRLYDAATGARGKKLEWADQPIKVFAFSSDGSSLFTGAQVGWDALLRRFDAKTGDSAGEYRITKGRDIETLAVSPNGALVAVGTRDSGIELVDAKKLTALRKLGKAQKGVTTALAFSPNSQRVASITGGILLEVWDAQTGTSTSHATLDRPWNNAFLAFSRDGSRIRVSGGQWGDVVVDIDTSTGQALASKKLPSGHAVLSPDAALVAVGYPHGGLSIVDAATGNVTIDAPGSHSTVEGLAIADGEIALARRLREGTNDRIEIFVAGVRGDEARFLSTSGYKAILAFSRGGHRLAGSFGGRDVRVWDAASGKPVELPEALEWIDALTFASPDVLRAAGGPFELSLFSEKIGQPWSRDLKLDRRRNNRAFALSPERSVVALDDQLLLFEFGKKESRKLTSEKEVRALAISGDSKTLVMVSPRGMEKLALPGGSPRKLLSGRCTDGPVSVSEDGATVLARCSSRELTLFSASGSVSESGDVNRLALSPQARFVATERDGRVAILGMDLKPRVRIEFAPVSGALIATGADGELERFGKAASGGNRAFCRVGNRATPFELCEDALYRDDLLKDALLGAP